MWKEILMVVFVLLGGALGDSKVQNQKETQNLLRGLMNQVHSIKSSLSSIQEELKTKPSIQDLEALKENLLPEIVAAFEKATSDRMKRSFCFRNGYHQYFQDSCFFFSPDSLTWPDAQRECHQLSGNLAQITSEEEFRFLQNEVIGENTWIGLNDRETEGNYTWSSDGSILAADTPQSWWLTGEPSDDVHHDDEDCIHFYYKNGQTLWNDRDCLKWKHRYICETPALDV